MSAFGQVPTNQWQKTFGGTSDDVATVIKQTSDGGYVLGGFSTSGVSGNKTNGSFGGSDFWVVKVDTIGVKQWDKSFGGTGQDQLWSLQQTSDGGYILGGYSDSSISGNKTNAGFGGSDYWVVKIDANGNKQWDKSFGGIGSSFGPNDWLQAVQQTHDGGYILGGYSDSTASGNKTNAGFGNGDFWIVRLDTNGNKVWDKSFGGTGVDYLTSLKQTSDDSYILGGYSNSTISGNKTNGGFGSNDFWVVKLDINGNKVWDKSLGGTGDDYLGSPVIPPTSFYISNATVLEGNTGVTNATFEVRLYPPTVQTSLVSYATADGSAVAELDYISTNGVLTFLPGITNQFINVGVKGDLVSENTEIFNVLLSNPTNALISTNNAVGSVLDNDDPLPILYLDTASSFEGDTGTNNMVFNARLSAVSGRTITAMFTIGSGTAVVGSDLNPASGQLIFPPGITNQTFQVGFRGDTINEPDEFFFVNISNVSNAIAAFTQSSGLILNDDSSPGKLDHFELGPLAPVVQGQPFWFSVEARDAWNYPLPNINSPFALDGYRGNSSNMTEILTWTRWVSTGRYPQILTALSNSFADFHEMSATTLDPMVLDAFLINKDVFLVPPQDAPAGFMGVLGTSWATVLNRFVNRGGVVIVCSDNYDEHLLLANSGFLQLQRLGYDFSGDVVIGSPSRVTEGVSNSFTGSFVSTYTATNGLVALRTVANNYAVVIQREMGDGAVFMIGSGFFSLGSQMDRVLANAVRWNYGTTLTPISLLPSTSLTLTNGRWAAPITISQSGEKYLIHASDSSGRLGWTGFFDVAADLDGDGMPDSWEIAFGLNIHDPTDASQDQDGDGATNSEEYLAGTNPILSESVLNITIASTSPQLILQFPSSIGRHYAIEYTEDVSAFQWTTLGEPFIGTGGSMQIILPISQQLLFFRVRLIL